MCRKLLDFLHLKSISFFEIFSKTLQNSAIFVKISEISTRILGESLIEILYSKSLKIALFSLIFSTILNAKKSKYD
ncbi:MAG: hypothetical protein PUC70_06695 [bacterium]|nr:hypothetical protein [bacterium]